MGKRYVLLNKDKEVAIFKVGEQGSTKGIVVEKVNETELFPWITDIPQFLEERRAPRNRYNMDMLFEEYKCNDLEGFLNVSHALSLNDTLWVKEVGQDLEWKDVSLYSNGFNTRIADMALQGIRRGISTKSLSPEFCTGGSFAKCWKRTNGIVQMVKLGTTGAANAGLEPVSEFLSSKVLDAMSVDSIRYGLKKVKPNITDEESLKHKSRLASTCDLFTSEEVGFLPFKALGIYKLEDIIKYYKEHGWEEQISEMFVADAVIVNMDRHLNNFGLEFVNNTGEILGPAPLFDHNLSLVCYAMESDFEQGIRKYMAEMHMGHSLGGKDFESVSRELLTPKLKMKLLRMRDFQFDMHAGSVSAMIPEWRKHGLEKLVQGQVELLLQKQFKGTMGWH